MPDLIEWRPADDIVAGALTFPDTPAARSSHQLVTDVSEDCLANHQIRSYLWATLLGRANGVRSDPEEVFVSAVLHDLGLTEQFRADGCFEEVGGSAAAQFLEGLGWPPERAASVKRNIVLHVEPNVSLKDGPEAYVVDIGISCDVTGRRLETITPDDRERVLSAYPRLDFKRRFVEVLRTDAAAQPACATAVWLDERDLAGRIASAGFDS